MSTILTTRYHRNKTLSDMTPPGESHMSDGIDSRLSRHGVFLSDFDESEQATQGEYFGEIPFNQTSKSPQVNIQFFLLSNKILFSRL